MTDEPVPRGRMSNRRRAVVVVAVLVVAALVVGAFWWRSDGQQRRRAMDGLGDLPGVASAGVVGGDDRNGVVTMRTDATVGEVTQVLRRGVPVLTSSDFDLLDLDVGLGAARTSVSELDVGDGGDAYARAEVVVALRDLLSGTADVAPLAPVLLRADDRDRSDDQRFSQVVEALHLLDRADVPVPRKGLWGDGLLRLSEIEVPPADLARALGPLTTLLDDHVEPEAVTGGLVNLTVPDDLGRARTRALLDGVADRLVRVRVDGRPVVDRLHAETVDHDHGVTVRVG